jgi:hypothetical protein
MEKKQMAISPPDRVIITRKVAMKWDEDMDEAAMGFAGYAREQGFDYVILMGFMGAASSVTRAIWELEGHETGEIDVKLTQWWAKVLHHCIAILAAAHLPAKGQS